ncbi:MAG: hypothetical protein P1P81_11170, partial [Desulfobulbales bacterium]|nr:hypothetical protein [Desulfobulbales bacterium]
RDPSFIPRAFSFSHINLTHRNWTAVGQPDLPIYPIVDPHGLATPLHDGWSIDCWFHDDEGNTILPSRLKSVDQQLRDDANRRVITRSETETASLTTETSLDIEPGGPVLKLTARAQSSIGGWLIFTLRPYNPEGVQFIEKAALLKDGNGWLVNNETRVRLAEKPGKILFSDYREGDVFSRLAEEPARTEKTCRIGMVTSAAFHRVEAYEEQRSFTLSVPLPPSVDFPELTGSRSWAEAEMAAAELRIPDARIKFLYDAATRTLIHLSAGSIIPGPYTYNRFWFRDACVMLNALLAIGLPERSRRHLDTFAGHQTREGFFRSQDGEWDSNGQVLWIWNRYRLLSGGAFNPDWIRPMLKGAGWLDRKRIFSTKNPKVNGLLPPGFSAEHFGPNDNYYWDDFWAVAGLKAAADTMAARGLNEEEETIRKIATEMEKDLLHSIALVAAETRSSAIPTSPNRRLDSGAIGAIVADYPLQLLAPGDKKMLATAGYLMHNCMQKGSFFQDMIHSGINIYMTLELAQVYLRAGDLRFRELMDSAADLASPTGQWPEAIHPLTEGGCMGDGQHGWAAAEWLMLIRNMFVMDDGDRLLIGRGVLPEWVRRRKTLAYGPTLTPFGKISVVIDCRGNRPALTLAAEWYATRPREIVACLPGYKAEKLVPPDYRCLLAGEEQEP